jgi:Ca-activated chloride channel homolog
MALMKPGRERRRAEVLRAPTGVALQKVARMALVPLLFVLAAASGLSRLRAPAANDPKSQVLRSEADLVVLPVTVTDHKGNLIPELTQGDFRVFENGRPQTISYFAHNDVPVTVGLVIDSSGSMRPNRDEVAQAAKDLLISSNARDEFFVVNFNESVSFGLPPIVPFTNDVAQLQQGVLSGPSAGMTALYDATSLALNHLAMATNDKKALIVISDGGDNASHKNFRQLLDSAQHSDAIVYTIGIISELESDVNPGVLRTLAGATGGDAYFPKSAADLPGICQHIARELREQYTIGYISANPTHDGSYRKLRVAVHAPGQGGLAVRTRAGYFAPSGAAGASVAKSGG